MATLEELFAARARLEQLQTAAAENARLQQELHQARETITTAQIEAAEPRQVRAECNRLLERVEAAEKAAEQARVLYQRDQDTLRALTQQVEELKALPDPEPAKKPWWRFGK